jgi:hypothetical protein
MYPEVVARADRGKPVRRLALETGKRVVYLANPERIDAVEAGESYPIGFPMEDVFEFDEAVFAILVEQWARQRATDPAIWRKLKPYALRASRG